MKMMNEDTGKVMFENNHQNRTVTFYVPDNFGKDLTDNGLTLADGEEVKMTSMAFSLMLKAFKEKEIEDGK